MADQESVNIELTVKNTPGWSSQGYSSTVKHEPHTTEYMGVMINQFS